MGGSPPKVSIRSVRKIALCLQRAKLPDKINRLTTAAASFVGEFVSRSKETKPGVPPRSVFERGRSPWVEGGFCKERYEVYQDKTKQEASLLGLLLALLARFLVFLKGISSSKSSPIVQAGALCRIPAFLSCVLSLAYSRTRPDRRFLPPDAMMPFPGKKSCRQSPSLSLLPSRFC